MAKIVHVDDEFELTKVVKEILEIENHTVTSFNNINVANRFLHTTDEEIDLVILDGTINKPFDGRNEAERLQHRRDTTGRGLKVILLTGDPEYSSKNEGFANLRKVGKPISMQELFDAVNQVLAS